MLPKITKNRARKPQKTLKLSSGENLLTLNEAANLPKGLYFVILRLNNEDVKLKLIKD